MLLSILYVLLIAGAGAFLVALYINSLVKDTKVLEEPKNEPEEDTFTQYLEKKLDKKKKEIRSEQKEWENEFIAAIPETERPTPDHILHPEDYDFYKMKSPDGRILREYYAPATQAAIERTRFDEQYLKNMLNPEKEKYENYSNNDT